MGFGIGCGFSLSMALPLDVAHDGASVAATTGLMLLVAYADRRGLARRARARSAT